ncbi:MAG: DUF507 family protein [Acidobacteria bacterium]|nr:DUF507 family protein [Acidobacteriota bacterium]
MRLTREKVVRISHKIIEHFVASEDIEFVEDRETIRQEMVNILQILLKEEEAMDAQVRLKISSQKKEIPEGSQEWDVLYRKYYTEELRRLGVVDQQAQQQHHHHR